jgi:hypothetical protein
MICGFYPYRDSGGKNIKEFSIVSISKFPRFGKEK